MLKLLKVKKFQSIIKEFEEENNLESRMVHFKKEEKKEEA